MSDALDVDLRDDQMVDEIRMVTELMVIASMTSGELEQDVIDQALGVDPALPSVPVQRDGRTTSSPAREVGSSSTS